MHPLLENYEKYYGKKEKPKIPRIEDYEGEKTIADELKEIQEVSSLSKEQHEVLAPYLSSPYLSTTSGTSGIASVSYITASNSTVSITPKPKAIKTFDPEYSKDCFLQIAEKIKDQTAKVTCITMNADVVSNFHTGLRTIIFEVQVYDAP